MATLPNCQAIIAHQNEAESFAVESCDLENQGVIGMVGQPYRVLQSHLKKIPPQSYLLRERERVGVGVAVSMCYILGTIRST